MRRRMRFIFTRLSFLPGAAGIRVSILLAWAGVGRVSSQSLVGVLLLSAFLVVEGKVYGFFNRLIASFLRILGSLLVLGSSGSM